MTMRAERISFAYPGGNPVLHDLTLDLKPGVVTGVFGPNGSGKSTLLRCLNGALPVTEGRVFLEQRSLTEIPRGEIARHIAVVPQNTPADIPLTVHELVMLGRFPYWTRWQQESPEDLEIVDASLERMDLIGLKDRLVSHLSGGERQRAVIARALAQQGRFLFLDEPIAHLDLAHQMKVYGLVQVLAGEGMTILMICHDLLIAPLFINKAILMKAGRIIAHDEPATVLTFDNLTATFETAVDISWAGGRSVTAILGQ